MNKLVLLFGTLLIGSTSFAQTDAEKYAATITKEDLKKQLTIVASPEMEGRETATEGQRKAAAYIVDQFKQLGLKAAPRTKDYLQHYPVVYDTIATATLNIDGKALTLGKDFNAYAEFNKSKKIKSKQVVFVGYGIADKNYDDYAGRKVRGKIVLMFAGEPKSDSLYRVNNSTRRSRWSNASTGIVDKVALARKKGAKAVLFVSPLLVSNTSQSRRTALYYPEKDKSKMANVAIISHATAEQLVGKQKFDVLLSQAKTGRAMDEENLVVNKQVTFDFGKNEIKQSSSNVVGYIKGTDKKKEYVVLTAHYDHLGVRNGKIYLGADDDGSGTVAILEMAEAFAKANADGKGPRRSIVFMAVSGEEKGLWGSKYYSEHPLFKLKRTSVNLNTDMIGRMDPERKEGDSTNYVYVIGEDKLSSELMPITEEVNKKYTKLELDRKFNDPKDINRIYYRSDHYNFAQKGVPIIFYFNGIHADYHKPTDSIDKINFALMTKRAKLVFHTAWEMANRDGMVKRDIPLPEVDGE